MRVRLALLAAAIAAGAATIPSQASAVLSPDCATTLQNAAAGAASSCSTQGPPPVECMGCGVRRTVDAVVTRGAADVTLVCDGLTYTTHVDGPGKGSVATWGGLSCTARLTATVSGTVAAATSTASYVVATETKAAAAGPPPVSIWRDSSGNVCFVVSEQVPHCVPGSLAVLPHLP